MEETLIFTSDHYYKAAESALERHDLFDFASKIGKAEILSANDPDMLAQIAVLKIRGLFRLRQYRKLLENIGHAYTYISPEQMEEMQIFEGIALGYTGNYVKAREVFLSLLNQHSGESIQVRTALSIAWLDLLMYKHEQRPELLDEVKKYLELVQFRFSTLDEDLKRRTCINYSVYYYYRHEYDQAIAVLSDAINYSSEAQLPDIYNNLAEVYLQSDQHGVAEKVYEYTEKAELIGAKYQDYTAQAKAFYTRATAEVREGQLFRALDTLYLAFEYFKKGEAFPYAFDCLIKMNELVMEYKLDRLRSLKNSIKVDLWDTGFSALL